MVRHKGLQCGNVNVAVKIIQFSLSLNIVLKQVTHNHVDVFKERLLKKNINDQIYMIYLENMEYYGQTIQIKKFILI